MPIFVPSPKSAAPHDPGRRISLVLKVVILVLTAGVLSRAAGNQPGFRNLPGSVTPVSPSTATPRQPFLLRTQLTPDEDAEPLEIEVALQMRNYDELLQRIGRGEIISRTEMAGRFYPLAADYEQVAGWIAGQGLTVTERDPARLAIFATGSVKHVGHAFQTRFGRVLADDGEYTSAIAPPQIPGELAGFVLGVNGLQPHLHLHKHTRLKPASFTSNAPPYLPRQIAHAYDADSLPVTGAGQKIAIVIDTFPAQSDLTSFWSACGVSQSLGNIEFVQVIAGSLPATSGEETLDVEWSSAMAPGAKVRVYATRTLSFVRLDQAYARISSDLSANPDLRVMSLSYGLGETYTSASQMQTDAQYFANLASAGVTILVSSGDGGSSPGSGGHDHTGPVQAETPASDPNVTAVGGTSLNLDPTTGNISSESAWFDGGGGISIQFNRPSWQTGPGVPAGTKRLVPDVAAAADLNTGGLLVWNGATYIVGGTSWSAPIWAGFSALINQSRTSNGLPVLGLLGPKIYPLGGTGVFLDIATGNNGADGVYNAGPGFDLCTGLGTPDMGLLAFALTPLPPNVTAQPQSQTVVSGNNASFTISASGALPITYQWQLSTNGGGTWINLSDSAPYNGTSTATLSIANANENLNGASFRCVLTNVSGTIVSNAVSLSVTAADSDVPAMPTWSLVLLTGLLFSFGRRYLASPQSARG